MEERSYTTQTDLNLNHAVGRSSNCGLSPIISLYTKMAATVAFIFCVANTLLHKSHKYGLRAIRNSTKKRTKKGNPNTALTPQSAPFFGLALNSLRSNNALTSPKNSTLYWCGIRGIKSTIPPINIWKNAA